MRTRQIEIRDGSMAWIKKSTRRIPDLSSRVINQDFAKKKKIIIAKRKTKFEVTENGCIVKRKFFFVE